MKECIFEPQSLLVKNYEKLNRVMIAEINETMFLSLDGYVGYLIPKEHWILGNLKFTPITINKERCIGNDRDYVPATIKGTLICPNGKEVLVLESEHESVYLDPKLLKNSFPKNIRLFVNDHKSMVRVYDGSDPLNLLGVILPVKVGSVNLK